METLADIFHEIMVDAAFGWRSYDLTEDEAKTWGQSSKCFELYLGYKEAEVEVVFYSSNPPMYEDIVSLLVLDAHAAQEKTFDDFCDAYDYNNDSIKALRTYEACQTNASKLKLLFGEELYNRFMHCEE